MKKENQIQLALVLALVLLSPLTLGRSPLGHGSTLQNHSLILIERNSEFTAENGVRSGTGTSESPYIISDWDITVPVTTYIHTGIQILGTDAYFVIRNVYIHTLESADWDINLENVANGRIENSRLTSLPSVFYDSRSITITGNSVVGFGFKVEYSSNMVIYANNFANGSVLQLDYSSNILIYHNNFLGAAPDNHGTQNLWDNGYPSGGNFWWNYPGVDNCSGPNQNICLNPDGIGDTPFGNDRYPLMKDPPPSL